MDSLAWIIPSVLGVSFAAMLWALSQKPGYTIPKKRGKSTD
ncbi:hypothetical protein [Bacillus massilinigeriensis]|nr:hypothetical protein [Bacillus mediterraneensis]